MFGLHPLNALTNQTLPDLPATAIEVPGFIDLQQFLALAELPFWKISRRICKSND